MASAKRTGRRSWSAQYSGVVTARGSTGLPVTVEISGISGATKETCCNASVKAATAGSINGEWKAWPPRSRRTRRPRSRQACVALATVSASPEKTTEFGPLTAAITRVPSISAR